MACFECIVSTLSFQVGYYSDNRLSITNATAKQYYSGISTGCDRECQTVCRNPNQEHRFSYIPGDILLAGEKAAIYCVLFPF